MPPKSAKERYQAYMERIRADPVKLADYRRRHREKWAERRLEGKAPKLQAELGRRDQNAKRKRWTASQRQSRQRKRDVQQLVSPPTTPETSSADEVELGKMYNGQRKAGRKRVAKR
jgi:hypothetical protein